MEGIEDDKGVSTILVLLPSEDAGVFGVVLAGTLLSTVVAGAELVSIIEVGGAGTGTVEVSTEVSEVAVEEPVG